MRAANLFLIMAVAAAGSVPAGWFYLKWQAVSVSQPPAVTATMPQPESQAVPVLPPPTAPAVVQESSTPPEHTPQTIVMESNLAPKAAAQKSPHLLQSTQTRAPQGKPPVQDQLARVALSWVGADPNAEAYWLGAINDPSLSAQERQDLIEDLNEDGLTDPKHPSVEDLPLIVNRLQLLQELAPYAMDQVNADAFAEAGKDLLNLYARLVQQL